MLSFSFLGCTGGVLRLVGSEGRLEACVEDQWISVCGNGWTENAGNIACRQLGYESGKGHAWFNIHGQLDFILTYASPNYYLYHCMYCIMACIEAVINI